MDTEIDSFSGLVIHSISEGSGSNKQFDAIIYTVIGLLVSWKLVGDFIRNVHIILQKRLTMKSVLSQALWYRGYNYPEFPIKALLFLDSYNFRIFEFVGPCNGFDVFKNVNHALLKYFSFLLLELYFSIDLWLPYLFVLVHMFLYLLIFGKLFSHYLHATYYVNTFSCKHFKIKCVTYFLNSNWSVDMALSLAVEETGRWTTLEQN